MQGAKQFDPDECRRWMADTFVVDPAAGSLVWKNPPKNHPRLKGCDAGSPRTGGSGKTYIHIKRDKVAIKRGWLIFLWLNGRWPVECLDHRDGDSTNDRSGNIREATVTQNAWNHHKRAKRADLPVGVRSIQSGRYQARIAHNKKVIHLGAFDTPEQAHSIYLAKRRELYHEFA